MSAILVHVELVCYYGLFIFYFCYCSFNLHILDDCWNWASFYVPLVYSCVFFCGVFSKVLCPLNKFQVKFAYITFTLFGLVLLGIIALSDCLLWRALLFLITFLGIDFSITSNKVSILLQGQVARFVVSAQGRTFVP